MEKAKIDLNTINEIKIRYRKIQTGLEEHEEKYVLKQNFQKELNNLK